ncbi:unnamed protein product [Lactuca virosa]|uniref:Agenet domain-containing protein n=1 Tax=Lactuca virosa TaxID=75947 RepID=A0AAU9PFU7_9ASTR|nr:unnamed protein product [Lactuca virosa]
MRSTHQAHNNNPTFLKQVICFLITSCAVGNILPQFLFLRTTTTTTLLSATSNSHSEDSKDYNLGQKTNLTHHEIQERKYRGDNYTVSYDIYPGFTNKEDVQQISPKSIRPCPPLLETPESWVPGDVVEVFHNLSWKMAIVLNALNMEQFVVRLVGSSQELKVTKSELRVPQSFQNGEWIVVDKFKTLNSNSCKVESVMSSSDSCSIYSYNGSDCFEDIERRDSDAESVCEMEYVDDDDGCVSLEDEIHRLELNAYRCTMEALHASGPLTWEKETMGQSSGLLACTPFASASCCL